MLSIALAIIASGTINRESVLTICRNAMSYSAKTQKNRGAGFSDDAPSPYRRVRYANRSARSDRLVLHDLRLNLRRPNPVTRSLYYVVAASLKIKISFVVHVAEVVRMRRVRKVESTIPPSPGE